MRALATERRVPFAHKTPHSPSAADVLAARFCFALLPLLLLPVFRGSNWYYYFHWHHHRFTNDPERDPELSGSTTDRIDPTADPSGALRAMLLFLSGWPFGFERIPNMAQHVLRMPPAESWVDTDPKRAKVRVEYTFYLLGYLSLAAAGLSRPATVGRALWYYWLLPHILGAGHLRYYQLAEHRGCKMGKFTDTNAWLVSRACDTRLEPPISSCPRRIRIALSVLHSCLLRRRHVARLSGMHSRLPLRYHRLLVAVHEAGMEHALPPGASRMAQRAVLLAARASQARRRRRQEAQVGLQPRGRRRLLVGQPRAVAPSPRRTQGRVGASSRLFGRLDGRAKVGADVVLMLVLPIGLVECAAVP